MACKWNASYGEYPVGGADNIKKQLFFERLKKSCERKKIKVGPTLRVISPIHKDIFNYFFFVCQFCFS